MAAIDDYIKDLQYALHKKYGHCQVNRQYLSNCVHFFYKPEPTALKDFKLTYTELEENMNNKTIPEKINQLLK